jgi:hypothetical protein
MPEKEPISRPAAQQNPAPPATSFWARQSEFYHRLLVQRAIVVIVLAAAAYVQFYLVNLPSAELSQTAKFSPATVKATEQLVSFENPETDPGQFEFGFEQAAESQNQRMVVDAYFDQATLSDTTMHKLAALGVQPPPGAAPISYLTSDDQNVRCNTAVQIQTKDAQTDAVPKPARAVEFRQSELAPSDRHRLLEVKMQGSDSTVTLSSQGTFGDALMSPSSCKLTLHVAGWQQVMPGFIPVVVDVPAGSSYRLRWEAADVKTKGWNTVGPALPLLSFGHARRQSFHTEKIGVFAEQTPEQARAHDGLVALCERKDAPLTVDSLLIGTDHLQFAASGKGRAWENGSPIGTVNLLDTINKYPLIAAVFGAANLALLNWAKRRFFPSPNSKPAEVVPFPREDGKKPDLTDEAAADDKAASG